MNSYLRGKKLLCGDYSSFTKTGKSYFVKRGRYFKKPKVGDIAYYYSKELKRVAHVGIVIFVKELLLGRVMMKVIEGNTSSEPGVVRNGGSVSIKTYIFTPGEQRYDGFGRPDYGSDTCTAEELIQVAMNELGYLEKRSNRDLSNKTANAGESNFTKYGEWYGMNGAYWCQMFVSWCAYMACDLHKNSIITGWKKADDYWYYYNEEGSMVKGSWSYINGRWYVFDASGRMIKGWFQSGDDWYYLGEDGGMLSGQWLDYQGSWYYLDKSGLMVKDALVKQNKGNGYDYVDHTGRFAYQVSSDNEKVNDLEIVA